MSVWLGARRLLVLIILSFYTLGFLLKLVSGINSSVACFVGIDDGALHNARWDDEEFVVSIKHD